MKILQSLFVTFLLLLLSPAFAGEGHLLLIDKNKKLQLPVADLRAQAKTEFSFFSPLRSREIKVRGVLLDTLLEQYLGRVPKRIKLVAIDGYKVTFENWQKNHWLIVTHEDDQPLSLRQHGPLRIIERNYGDKNPQNLRSFNDWVWMLQRIETL